MAEQEGPDFERIGIALMPVTIAGWCYLVLCLVTKSVVLFGGTALWEALGWPGTEVVHGVILTGGIVATLRFAYRRSG